jgi:hypothetical protein
MFKITIEGERVKQIKDKLERMSYHRTVIADNLDDLEDRLNEIPEIAVIKESRGITSIERVARISVA